MWWVWHLLQMGKHSHLQLVSWVAKSCRNMSRLVANTSHPVNNDYNSNPNIVWTILVFCKLSETPLYQYLNCISFMSPNAVFVVLCCLKELCIFHLSVPYHHLTFCHSAIVHSLQLCSVEMHSLAHFDTCVEFAGGIEIQFLMFCWLVKFYTGFSMYTSNFVSYGRKYRYTRKSLSV